MPLRTLRRLFWTPSGAGASFLGVSAGVGAYLALALNAPEFWQRLGELEHSGRWASWGVLAAEAVMVWGACCTLLGLAGLGGRWCLAGVSSLMLILSAACVHYMVRFDVVIGYGIVQAVLGPDQTLSGESAGWQLLVWVLLLGVLPAWGLIAWLRRVPPQADARRGWSMLGVTTLGLVLCLSAQRGMAHASQALQANASVGLASASGQVAHRYVPTNWLSGLGMMAANRVTTAVRDHTLQDPAELFDYTEATPLDDVTVVLVIGETARHDHMGLLGYWRDTTPGLGQQKNLAAFRAQSCDTVTRLSLACMFVRPEGVRLGDGFSPDVIHEEKVFSVFRSLGFSIDLFAMQAEAGFYHRVGPDFYKLREVIAAQPGNQGMALDGMLLPEVKASLARRASGRHMIVLHLKGSHFEYSKRYPREFARWQPECSDVDVRCSRQTLVNAYDNSMLYTDHVLTELTRMLEGRKALMVYTSDHGESIGDGVHFHGTPRAIAPPEQRRVPLIFWASEALLADPVHRQAFERAQALAQAKHPASHQHLFASMLGCLSVRSPDGGLTPGFDLCRAPS